MDYQFPQELFPSFYNCAPPNSVLKHSAGDWGGYDQVRPQGGSGPLSSWTFISRHQVVGETWRHTEPVPLPLLSPKHAVLWPSTPPDPLDFTEHMQNFFMDHSQDAFGCMGEILGKNFNFKPGSRGRKDSVDMWRVKNILDLLKLKICERTYSSKSLDAYSVLLSDVVHTVPPELLGPLLHEELTEQRDRMLFSEGATGGAMAFLPFPQRDSDSQPGCLLYPSNQGLDCLNFHRVELQHHRGGSSCVDVSSSEPFSFQLKGPIRQVTSASLFNQCCVGVRSDHLCGVWRFSESNEPRLLQVVNTGEVATCISVSPHVLGEVLVASESGAANLWTVGKGMQKVREEEHNLYFNAKSPWRWCEFSAHPRVMLYADRTGVELSDMRVSDVVGHTLFRISNTSECRSGERLIVSRYLGDVHSFHHLLTTQYSAYIMDERFPSVPMLKCDHMMQSPPLFTHVVPGSASSGAGTTKIVLGSQSSQEITLLQYSGGRVEACSSRGPPQALLRPRDSLKQLPVQIPHRLDMATNRLSSPAAGLTCIQMKGGVEDCGEECVCVLQLTEAGDIFYQILEPEQSEPSPPAPAAEDRPLPQPAAAAPSQPVVSDTSSDEGVIQPTQHPTAPRHVAETPEREQPALDDFSDYSSDDSESARRFRNLRRLKLQVVVNNEDPEPDSLSDLETGVEDGIVGKNNADNTEAEVDNSHVVHSKKEAPVKLSDGALLTWKRWLQKLVKKSGRQKGHRASLKHLTMDAQSLLQQPEDQAVSHPQEEQLVESLRQELRETMSKRSLLVTSAVQRAPAIVAVPEPVETAAWEDPLSQRLSLSWQGEAAWRAWWDDQLGLNMKDKQEALRRKRRREKEARRAGGRRLTLSGSFTSSPASCRSDLDDFSDLSGWSSAGSQGAWSDSSQPGTPRAVTPTNPAPTPTSTPTPTPTPTVTPQSLKGKPAGDQTPSTSRLQALNQSLNTPAPTPATHKKNKRPADDYISSLFASQGDASQQDGYFVEDELELRQPPPLASSSQLRSSQPGSQRGVRVGLSSAWSSPWSRPFSQSSQGRRSQQASQPKKKKYQMGF